MQGPAGAGGADDSSSSSSSNSSSSSGEDEDGEAPVGRRKGARAARGSSVGSAARASMEIDQEGRNEE